MPEVSRHTAAPIMTPAEREYRRTEAEVPVGEFEDRLRAFLMHARDSRVNGPTSVEVVEEIPIDGDLRQDAVVALEILGRVRDVFTADVQLRGEATPGSQRFARSQPDADPRYGAGRNGSAGRQISDWQIGHIAQESDPDGEDLDGLSFDEYIRRQANLDGEETTDEDVAASSHSDLPEYDDGPASSPEEVFRREVERVCEGVCRDCGERAKRLIEAGVTTEKLLADMTAFIRLKAGQLKPAGGELQQ